MVRLSAWPAIALGQSNPLAEVVDGQQRLTTLTILLAVLRDIERGEVGEDIQRSYICQEGSVTRGIPALEPEQALMRSPQTIPTPLVDP